MIEIQHLSKTFSGDVEALRDINLTIDDGDVFGIIGLSGAGKSTLVRCINFLEKPTEGTVKIDGQDLSKMSKAELRELRRSVTMIFQHFNLLAQRTCLKNICFPLELQGVPRAKAEARARELLEIVGLPDKANAYPSQLSGGQQQRIAIARALATDPKILLCDEATSALDPTTTCSILDLIRDINRKLGITVVIITHQMNVVENICRRVAILDGGTVVEQGEVGTVFSRPKSAAARRLVFPEGEGENSFTPREGERFIRLVFNGAASTGKPVIAHMAVKCGIEANIYSAATRTIDSRVYGNMLLGILGGEEKVREAIGYLQSTEEISAEEVSIYAGKSV